MSERYGLRVFRRRRQRNSTFVLQGPEKFVEDVFWPLFEKNVRALVVGMDGWLHGVIEVCIRDDVADGL